MYTSDLAEDHGRKQAHGESQAFPRGVDLDAPGAPPQLTTQATDTNAKGHPILYLRCESPRDSTS